MPCSFHVQIIPKKYQYSLCMIQEDIKIIRVAFVIYLLEHLKRKLNRYVTPGSINKLYSQVQNKNLRLSGTHIKRLYNSLDEAIENMATKKRTLNDERLSKVSDDFIDKLVRVVDSEYKDINQFKSSFREKHFGSFVYLSKAKSYLQYFIVRDELEFSKREDAFLGVWEGKTIDTYADYVTKMYITKTKTGRTINGSVWIVYHDVLDENNREIEFKLKGKIIEKFDYLKIEYQNSNKETIHFGYVLLKLSSDGKWLEGGFTGHGLMSEKIVHGEVKLSKIS